MTTLIDPHADDLDLLDDFDFHDDDPVPPPDAERATRMLWALAYAQRDLAAQEELFDAEIRRMEQRKADVTAGLRRKVESLTEALTAYHRAVRALDPKAATIHLPSGDLVSRKQQPEWATPDKGTKEMGALVQWCLDHGLTEAVVVPTAPEPYVDKAKLKKVLAAADGRAVSVDGEIAPGITVTERPPAFDVKPVEVTR